MARCLLSQLKHPGFSIASCERGLPAGKRRTHLHLVPTSCCHIVSTSYLHIISTSFCHIVSMLCFYVVSKSYCHIVPKSYFYIFPTSDCHIVFFIKKKKKFTTNFTSFLSIPFFLPGNPTCEHTSTFFDRS